MVSAWVESISDCKADLIAERTDLLLRLSEIQETLNDPDYVPERTCTVVEDVVSGQKQPYKYKICSECHSDFPRANGNNDLFAVGNYCPNCGAKVVDV